MSKRKRHDSLSKHLSTQSNDEYDLTHEDIVDENDVVASVENDLKSRKLFKSKTLENINVISNENVNLVNSPNSSDKSLLKNDNSVLRRKSNRILRLKRSLIVPGLQNGRSPHSPTTEDNSAAQQCSSSISNESLVSSTNNSAIASSSTDSTKATNQLTSEPLTSSTTNVSSTSLSAQTKQNSQTKSISNSNGPTAISTTVPGKALRKAQAWTEDDTRWFFEALCEHGKDFPHIQAYIATRCEKKGITPDMIKNYEQVRHYYYRMWHKISQMLNLSNANAVEKGIQEIYGLINYGEIWKKFGTKFDTKLSANLQQLVDYGFTVFKVKGKSVRVRTPICNALKRIHNINNKATINKPAVPIPKDVTVELLPATNADWIRVHSLAQNPRLRTQLTMQHRLSALIEYLEKRWSLFRVKENASRSLFNTNLLEEDEDNPSVETRNNFRIRLRPQGSEKLREQVQLKSTSNAISGISYRSSTHGNSQIDLSLSSYLNLFNKNDTQNEGKKASKMRKSTKKTSITESARLAEGKPMNEDNSKSESSKSDSQPIDLLKMLDSMNEELEVAKNKTNSMEKSITHNYDIDPSEANNDDEKDAPSPNEYEEQNCSTNHLPVPPAHTTIAEWLAGMHSLVDDKDDAPNDEEEDKTNSSTVSSNTASNGNGSDLKSKNRHGSFDNEIVHLLTAKQARLGWTLEEAQSVTIGELYLLFCCPNKIILEYSWVEREDVCQPSKETTQITQSEEALSEESLNQHSSATAEVNKSSIQSSSLSMLQRLLIAANITLSNIKKPANGTSTNLQSTATSSSSTPNTSQQLCKRKRATKSAPSQLLSNLIQETILDEGDNQGSNVNSNEEASSDARNNKAINSSNEAPNNTSDCNEKDHFVSPKLPAPRSSTAQSQSKNSKYRTATVFDDPSKVEEVLNELKTNKYRRQRRPLPSKPTPFNMYNLQKNKMFTPTKLANGTHSAILVIPASHLASATKGQLGQNSNQILLSNLLNSHLPQGSISLSTATTTSMTMASINQSTHHQQHTQGTAHSVMIPIQVETKQVPKDMPIITTSHSLQPQVITTTINSSNPMLESNISNASNTPTATNFAGINIANKYPDSLNSILSNSHPEHSTRTLEKSMEQQQPESAPCPSKGLNITGPSTADMLTHSQLSWLNEVNNDFSLGSLIAACDIVTNDELNHKMATEHSMTISSEIDTHVSSMANDNSVDLMAKFADLAAEISSDSKLESKSTSNNV